MTETVHDASMTPLEAPAGTAAVPSGAIDLGDVVLVDAPAPWASQYGAGKGKGRGGGRVLRGAGGGACPLLIFILQV